MIVFICALSSEQEKLIDVIYSKINAKLYNISYKLLCSHADAEDATATAFLRISENIEKKDFVKEVLQ